MSTYRTYAPGHLSDPAFGCALEKAVQSHMPSNILSVTKRATTRATSPVLIMLLSNYAGTTLRRRKNTKQRYHTRPEQHRLQLYRKTMSTGVVWLDRSIASFT